MPCGGLLAARLIEGGADRSSSRDGLYSASEDIGLDDPQAIVQASGCRHIVQMIVCRRLFPRDSSHDLSRHAPKSNAVKRAYSAAREDAEQTAAGVPPTFALRLPPSEDSRYGEGYRYVHDDPPPRGMNCYKRLRGVSMSIGTGQGAFNGVMSRGRCADVRVSRWSSVSLRRISSPYEIGQGHDEKVARTTVGMCRKDEY